MSASDLTHNNIHRAGSGSPFPWWERALHGVLFAGVTLPLTGFGKLLRKVKGRAWGASPAPNAVRSVLIVQVEHLGDFLVSSGFHQAVREAFPNAHITVLVDRILVNLIRNSPYFDEVIGFNQSGSKYYRLLAGPVRAYRLAKDQLWSKRFDVVINQRWDADLKHGAILGMFALGKYNIGFSSSTTAGKRVMSRGVDAMFTHSIDEGDLIHDGLRGGQLLQALGVPGGTLKCEIFTSDADKEFALEELNKIGEDRMVALGVGASQARHQWPIERYAEIALWIRDQWPDVKFLVVGNSADGAKAETLRSVLGDRLLNYAGKCSFGQSAELLRRASLYFGSDSGPMHMAAAQGLDIVEISCLPDEGPPDHPNSPIRYAPVGVRATVLRPALYASGCSYGCRAGESHCIKGVSIEMAKEALSESLSVAPYGKTLSAYSERI